jgi:hypothetical protein
MNRHSAVTMTSVGASDLLMLVGGAPDPRQAVARINALATAHSENLMPLIESIRSSGIETLDGIAAVLNPRGIKSARGRGFAPRQL